MQQEKRKKSAFLGTLFFIRGRGDSVSPSLLRKFKPREFLLFNPHRVEELSGGRIKDITLYVCSKDYILG